MIAAAEPNKARGYWLSATDRELDAQSEREQIRDAAVRAIGSGWKTADDIAVITGHTTNMVARVMGYYPRTFVRREKCAGSGYYGPTIYRLADGMAEWVEYERQSK